MKRGSGILVHISSFPSNYGIGDLGKNLYSFINFLKDSKQSYMQVLPMTPVELFYDCSPYHSISAFAFNHLFIDPESLIEEGLLDYSFVKSFEVEISSKVNFDKAFEIKEAILEKAFSNFEKSRNAEFEKFCYEHKFWLDDYCLFRVIKKKFKKQPWFNWPEEYKFRNHNSLNNFKEKFIDEINCEKFTQYSLYKQWNKFKEFANNFGIKIIGDMPIYVDLDSSDVWTNPEYFKLSNDGTPLFVAGVPPDYFSSSGQLWGNPVYNWDRIKESGFEWWVKRIKHSISMYDYIRIDHFRGLVAYWEVPSSENTAINGKWVPVPVYDLFDKIFAEIQTLPVIAEDLGVITPDVVEVMNHYGFPGMKVLQFAFGSDFKNPYLPHNYDKNCVVYTGTHDNNTTRGWYENEANDKEKKYLERYIGHNIDENNVNWELIRLAISSVANVSIFPIQDILGEGSSSRMNVPGTSKNNWRYRMISCNFKEDIKKLLKELTETFGR